jgi:hypothetical protein
MVGIQKEISKNLFASKVASSNCDRRGFNESANRVAGSFEFSICSLSHLRMISS